MVMAMKRSQNFAKPQSLMNHSMRPITLCGSDKGFDLYLNDHYISLLANLKSDALNHN